MTDIESRPSAEGRTELGQDRKRSRSRSSLAVGTLCGVLGAALLVMAIPRTIAAWISLGAEPVMLGLLHGEAVTAEELTQCVEMSERAIAWAPSADRLADLGSCEFALGRQAPTGSDERQRWLARAAAHTEEALRADPTDGYAWFRLALIKQWQGDAARQIIPDLMMSLEVRPNVQQLRLPRAEMLLDYARLLEPDDSAALRRHLHTIWVFAPTYRPKLLEIARRLNRVDILRSALAVDPEAEAEINKMEH